MLDFDIYRRPALPKLPPPQPRLLGQRNEFSFEMWVEMEGEPLLVHAPESVEVGDKSLAWIAGEEGKVSQLWERNCALVSTEIPFRFFQNYTVHCVIKRRSNLSMTESDSRLEACTDALILAAQIPLKDQRYPDLYVGCYIDGNLVAAKVPSGESMNREDGHHVLFTGRRISKGKKQKLCFQNAVSSLSRERIKGLPC